MTATLEQTQRDLLKLVNLVQQGEEVLLTCQGRAVARLSGVPQSAPSPSRQAWLARMAQLREQLSTGKTGPTVKQIREEDRAERTT